MNKTPSQTIVKNLGVGDRRIRDLQKAIQQLTKQMKAAQSGLTVRPPIVYLTREEYLLLDPPDPDTLYLIYEEVEDETTSENQQEEQGT